LQAYIALHTFEERSSFDNWVTRIAINSALIILRRRRTRAEVSYDGISETEEDDGSLWLYNSLYESIGDTFV